MPNRKKGLFRLAVFFIFLLVCFAYAGTKLYEIQIKRHDELLRKAQDYYTASDQKKNNRGEIYDRNGHLLVGNHFVVAIAFDPSIIKGQDQRRAIASLLSRNLPQDNPAHSYSNIYKRTMLGDTVDPETKEVKYKKYILLVKDVEFNLANEIEKLAIGLRLRHGMMFDQVCRRTYPKGQMLANVLGFSNIDGNQMNPVAGLEKVLKTEMKAEDGTITYERTRDGRMIDIVKDDAGHDGSNIYLTISEPLQAIVEEEVDKMYRETNAKAAYAIMADPATGDILALVQRPTFDPNDRSTMVGAACRNQIAMDFFEPGSVIKPFIVGMALDRGFITTQTRIDTGFGPWKYAGRLLNDTHYIGTVRPWQIIQHSSNIGTAMIAVQMGANNVYNTLKQFGFGTKTNLPVQPESKGILREPKYWSKLSVSRVCIGHELAVTSLQLLRAYCMLANGGYPLELRLVDSIESTEQGKRKKPYRIGKQSVFRNPQTHKDLITMMKTVTRPGGTSSLAGVPGFEVAGKTGTANKIENGKYVKGKYYASFCGFVPADNPKFVMVITCDEPQGKDQYGGSVAGPVFSRIASRALLYMDVPPDMSKEAWENDRKEWERARWKDVQRRENERKSKLRPSR